jgi:hypothetical protein
MVPVREDGEVVCDLRGMVVGEGGWSIGGWVDGMIEG